MICIERSKPLANEIDVLTERVAQLERSNRKLKLVFGFVLLSTVVLSLVSAAKPRIIEAEKIIIRDSHGRARVTIGTDLAIDKERDEPAIWLSDATATDRMILLTDRLYFADEHTKPLVELVAKPGNSYAPSLPGSALRFHAPDGKVLSTP